MKLTHGRVAMSKNEIKALCRMVKDAKTYIEIGTLWGGSAIQVALSNPDLTVYAVDPLRGYYGGKDEWADGLYPDKTLVLENLQDAGVDDRVKLITKSSYPFPLVNMTFDCGLIDGDHSPNGVLNDWNSLKTRCKKVAFHDVTDPNIYNVIKDNVDWDLVEKIDTIMIFEGK